MLLRETHLTFERIAHEWARELDDAKNPGRLNRDEIFLNMVHGVGRDQFANMVLTIERAPRHVLCDKDGQRYKRCKPAPGPITRETLDKVVLLRPGVRPRDPDASQWEFRTSLKLEDYDPLSLRAYLEPLTISKEDFGRWCDEQGHQRPQFWFGEQADARVVPPEPTIIAGIAKPPNGSGVLASEEAAEPAPSVFARTKINTEKNYLAHVEQTQQSERHYPTVVEDEAWREESNVSRLRMRELRKKHNRKPKGGAPKILGRKT